jgi:hypothetical protein
VKVKIDMPGSQKGVDLRFDKPVPMDWKEYSSHIKAFGPAIHKGDVASATAIVVKKDRIEFQLTGAASARSETIPVLRSRQSPSKRATTRRISKSKSPRPTMRTKNAAFSVTSIENGPVDSARAPPIRVTRKSPAS